MVLGEFEDSVFRVTPTNHESDPTNDNISGSDAVCDSITCSDDSIFFDYSHDKSDEENCDSVMDVSQNKPFE